MKTFPVTVRWEKLGQSVLSTTSYTSCKLLCELELKTYRILNDGTISLTKSETSYL